MALKPEISIPAGLATAAVVATIYRGGMPNLADIRAAEAGNEDVEAVRKQNAWAAAAVVGGISLIAKDPAIFIVGGVMLLIMDWTTRHADAVNPTIGKVDRVLRRTEQGEPTQAVADADAYAA
jgi:predicted NBD/HSP70 family sugar kinase